MHKDIVSLMHGVCCYGRENKTCITLLFLRAVRKPRWVVGWRLKPEVVPAWSDHAVPMVGSASQLELCRALHHIPSSLLQAVLRGRTLLRIKAVTVPTSSVCLWLLKHLFNCRT